MAKEKVLKVKTNLHSVTHMPLRTNPTKHSPITHTPILQFLPLLIPAIDAAMIARKHE